MSVARPRTLFQKVWDGHVVRPATADTPAVLFIDLHLIHEVTSPQAFSVLRERGLRVRAQIFDHGIFALPLIERFQHRRERSRHQHRIESWKIARHNRCSALRRACGGDFVGIGVERGETIASPERSLLPRATSTAAK